MVYRRGRRVGYGMTMTREEGITDGRYEARHGRCLISSYLCSNHETTVMDNDRLIADS